MAEGTAPLSRMASPGCRVSHLACLCSLTAHGLLAIVLALQFLPHMTELGPTPIESAVADEPDSVVPLDNPLSLPEESPPSVSAAWGLPGAAAASPVLAMTTAPAEITEQFAVSLTERPGDLTRQVAVPVQPAGGGAGAGAGGASGAGAGKGFFGLQELGGKTVFVVDASSSMNFPHPPPAGTRFRRVQLELLKTIAEMQPQQEFFIIFFSDQAIPMPADRLMPATPSAQQMYLHWMVNVQAQGRTRPLQAMLHALKLQPDTIYFLTDGAYPIKINDAITKANEKRVTIQTIGFGDDSGAEVLTDLAARNLGTYRFIPAGK